MNNETNRLAQIIATAADKYRAIRPGALPTGQDKAAAEAIEAEYLFIRKSAMPPVKEHSSYAQAGGWVLAGEEDNDLSRVRDSLAAYASWYMHLQAKEAANDEAKRELERRRDELAAEHFEGAYDHLPREGYRKAIDRIIELERNAA